MIVTFWSLYVLPWDIVFLYKGVAMFVNENGDDVSKQINIEQLIEIRDDYQSRVTDSRNLRNEHMIYRVLNITIGIVNYLTLQIEDEPDTEAPVIEVIGRNYSNLHDLYSGLHGICLLGNIDYERLRTCFADLGIPMACMDILDNRPRQNQSKSNLFISTASNETLLQTPHGEFSILSTHGTKANKKPIYSKLDENTTLSISNEDGSRLAYYSSEEARKRHLTSLEKQRQFSAGIRDCKNVDEIKAFLEIEGGIKLEEVHPFYETIISNQKIIDLIDSAISEGNVSILEEQLPRNICKDGLTDDPADFDFRDIIISMTKETIRLQQLAKETIRLQQLAEFRSKISSEDDILTIKKYIQDLDFELSTISDYDGTNIEIIDEIDRAINDPDGIGVNGSKYKKMNGISRYSFSEGLENREDFNLRKLLRKKVKAHNKADALSTPVRMHARDQHSLDGDDEYARLRDGYSQTIDGLQNNVEKEKSPARKTRRGGSR